MFLLKTNKKVIKNILPAFLVLLLFYGFTSVHADEDTPSRRDPPKAQYTEAGPEGCIACHAGERMTLMAETAHGNKDNPYTPYATHGCESCHGPGSLHSSRARGGVGFPALMTFQQGESSELQNQACTGCHGEYLGERVGMLWEGSLHQLRGITCNYCHQVHSVGNEMKDQDLQRERCSKCHSRKIEQHDDFASAGVEFERLSCSACHDVHQF